LPGNLEIPVACIQTPTSEPLTHPEHPQDSSHVQNLAKRLNGMLDLSEPFVRIRVAMTEARKTGAANRA
jgi:hypothetical protein